MLSNATAESPLWVNDPKGRLSKIHWGMIIAMYHKERFNFRWNSSHVYLTNRSKMRTSLAVRLFQPAFIDEVEQMGRWAAFIPYLRVGQAILASLGNPEPVKNLSCLEPLKQAITTLDSWNQMVMKGTGNRVSKQLVTGLQQTCVALEWLIPQLLKLQLTFSLRSISSDPVENWFSRLRGHSGLNTSFTVLNFDQLYVRMQLMTNGGEKFCKGSYEHESAFDLDLSLAELYERKTPSFEQFIALAGDLIDRCKEIPMIKVLRLTSLQHVQDATIKRLVRVGGWLLHRALTCGEFDDLVPLVQSLFDRKEGSLIVPKYGFLLWLAKVDQSTKKSMGELSLLTSFKSGFFYLQTMLMCNNDIFLDDFAQLTRWIRLQQNSETSEAWKTSRIPILAKFLLRLLSQSHLKDVVESEDLQKRKGGAQAFRADMKQMYEPHKKGATIPTPEITVCGRVCRLAYETQAEKSEMQWQEPDEFHWPPDLFSKDFRAGLGVLVGAQNLHPI